MSGAQGPLVGLRVVEFAGIGPGPHCAMLLADQGAEVLRIDRPGGNGWPNPVMDRSRALLELDIRTDEGRDIAIAAIERADVLIEGMRPGVMERLGFGPEAMLARNPRLIYGRMTGWGQQGPMARAAGHDINYIALGGALAEIGRPGEPAVPPLNLVGDFGGGSMFLAFGIMAALWERERSGKGQVIDTAIIDGVASMMAMFAGQGPTSHIRLDRSANILGGAAPYYRSYRCADGREISVGAIEPPFWQIVVDRLGAPPFVSQAPKAWPESIAWLTETFASQPAAHWSALFAGSDACVVEVVPTSELPAHPHHAARGSFVEVDGVMHPAPAPRFGRTPGAIQPTRDGAAVLERWRAGSGR